MKFQRPSCLSLCLCRLCLLFSSEVLEQLGFGLIFKSTFEPFFRSPDMFVIFPLH